MAKISPHTNQEESNLIAIAKLGKSVGLKGLMKCYPMTDFPEIFTSDITFFAQKDSIFEKECTTLHISEFNEAKSLIGFKEVDSIEMAKTLTNAILYTTLQDTKTHCALGEDEFFWFEVIGFSIIEDEETLGYVEDIERIGATDYLVVVTDPKLCTPLKLKKRFLIPYIDPYIISTDAKAHHIYTKNAKALLLAS